MAYKQKELKNFLEDNDIDKAVVVPVMDAAAPIKADLFNFGLVSLLRNPSRTTLKSKEAWQKLLEQVGRESELMQGKMNATLLQEAKAIARVGGKGAK